MRVNGRKGLEIPFFTLQLNWWKRQVYYFLKKVRRTFRSVIRERFLLHYTSFHFKLLGQKWLYLESLEGCFLILPLSPFWDVQVLTVTSMYTGYWIWNWMFINKAAVLLCKSWLFYLRYYGTWRGRRQHCDFNLDSEGHLLWLLASLLLFPGGEKSWQNVARREACDRKEYPSFALYSRDFIQYQWLRWILWQKKIFESPGIVIQK